MTPIIEVEGLWTRFGTHVVHQDLNLTVNPGEVVSLVGGSGSGKTTLMRQMLGLEQPSQGRVKVFGISLHDSDTATLKKIRKRWGVLFQEGALYSALSVYDNIALPLRELRVFDEDFVHDMVMLKLDMVDIERRHAWKMPSDLSGGMIKRIALARALVLEPELIFLDEPTAALGVKESGMVLDLITRVRDRGLSVILISHNMPHVFALADRIHIQRLGRRAALVHAKEIGMADAVAVMTGAVEWPAPLRPESV